MTDTCSFCRGPFHIASGDIVGDMRSGSKDYPFCGACIKEMRGWMKGHLNRKWSKTSFYAHANVPPPAVEKTFRFRLYRNVDAPRHTYVPFYEEVTGVHFHEAAQKLQEKYPDLTIPGEHMSGGWEELPAS